MGMTFQRYGSFTGPGWEFNYRDNDDFSPIEVSGAFPADVGLVLANTLNTPADYVALRLNGIDTSTVTLERSTGDIPRFNVKSTRSEFSGLVVATDVKTNSVSSLNSKSSYWDAKKGFDIPHPSKEDHRLRYICVEGPSAEVYLRGKLQGKNVIELPEYWRNLVDSETIGVTLTPIGYYQELFVEKIEWGTHIKIKNNNGTSIHCDYTVFAERKDTTKNIPEYKGLTPEDYPGDNSEYVINGKSYR